MLWFWSMTLSVCTVIMSMTGGTHLKEYQREQSKDETLHKADKKLETVERQWCDIRHQKANNSEEHFTSKNISVETEAKRDDFGKFRHEFKDTHTGANWIPEWIHEELTPVTTELQVRHTVDLRHDDRDEGNSHCHIHIRVGGSKEWNENLVTFFNMPVADRADAWKETKPVGDNNKKKDGRTDTEELLRLFMILCHGVKEVIHAVDDRLDEVLETAWNKAFCIILRKSPRNHTEEKHCNP